MTIRSTMRDSIYLLLEGQRTSFRLPVSDFGGILSVCEILLYSIFCSASTLSVVTFSFLDSSSRFAPIVLESGSDLSFSAWTGPYGVPS